MSNLDNVTAETLLSLAVDRLRRIKWMCEKVSADLAETAEEFSDFLDQYDEWVLSQEEKDA